MESVREKVKSYLLELNYTIIAEDKAEELFIIEDKESGIVNMIVDCEDEILIIEQHLFDIKNESLDLFKLLLQKNREIIHGAFVLDETGTRVIFRDTLQLESLDINELEGSIKSLELLLSEFGDTILSIAQ